MYKTVCYSVSTNCMVYFMYMYSPRMMNIWVNMIQSYIILNSSSTTKKTLMKQFQEGSCNGYRQKMVMNCSNIEISMAVRLKLKHQKQLNCLMMKETVKRIAMRLTPWNEWLNLWSNHCSFLAATWVL